MKQIINRLQASTPRYFKILRNISLILVAISVTIMTSPVPLPAIVVQTASYIGLAGAVAGAVAQTAVEGN